RRQVALGEVPDRLGVERAAAVDAAALRVAVDPGHRVRLARLALGPVDGADAGAAGGRGAGVAVATAQAAQPEAAADAGGIQAQRRVQVGDALAGARNGTVGPVVVQAVAPLVVEHAGELAGVAAAAALAVEVDRAAAPEGVAGVVEVHVRGQLIVEPVAGRPAGRVGPEAARHLGEPVELVEAGARGGGVAGRVTRRHGAVHAAGDAAEVEVAAGRALADRAAGVDHAHVRALELGRDVAGDVEQVAARVGGRRATRVGDVGVRHRIAGHLDAVGQLTVVGGRVDGAHDFARGVVIGVLEEDDLAVVGVDRGLVAGVRPVDERLDDPDQAVGEAGTGRAVDAQRQQLEAGLGGVARRRERREVRLHARLRVGARQARHGRDVDRGPALGAEQDQIAVVDRGRDAGAAHRHAVDGPGAVELDVLA